MIRYANALLLAHYYYYVHTVFAFNDRERSLSGRRFSAVEHCTAVWQSATSLTVFRVTGQFFRQTNSRSVNSRAGQLRTADDSLTGHLKIVIRRIRYIQQQKYMEINKNGN